MLRMLQLSVVFASAGAATIVWLVFGNRTDDGTAPILLGTFAIILAISLGPFYVQDSRRSLSGGC